MPQASYPIAMIAGVPVVTAPAGISTSNADQLRIALLEAAARGTGMLVLDMTSAQRCDTSGCHVLERAHHRAVGSRGELRLVITGGAVLSVLAAAGLDRLIPCYASLREAVSLSPADHRPRARRPGSSVASPV